MNFYEFLCVIILSSYSNYENKLKCTFNIKVMYMIFDLDQSKLVSQKTNSNYQQDFRQLGMQLSGKLDATEWTDMYAKLVFWELELENIEDSGMREILNMQKKEANQLFVKYI